MLEDVDQQSGRRVLSGSQDGTVRLWDVETGKEVLWFAAPREVLSLAVSPDGRLVLCGANLGARLWPLPPEDKK